MIIEIALICFDEIKCEQYLYTCTECMVKNWNQRIAPRQMTEI